MTKVKKLAAALLALLMLVLVASCELNTSDVATSIKKPATSSTEKQKKRKAKFTYGVNDVKVVFDNGEWRTKAKGKNVAYNGVAPTDDAFWYVKDGIVDQTVTSIVKDKKRGKEYYVKDGMVQGGYTGLAKGDDVFYWYIKNGVVDKSMTSVIPDPNLGGWRYVEKGMLMGDYTGFANNDSGTWYITKGAVDFSKTGAVKDEKTGIWRYVKEGKLIDNYIGFGANENGTWFFNNGEIDFSANGLINNPGTPDWYSVKDGYVDWGYTGIESNNAGSWYVENGKLNTNKNGDYYSAYSRYKIVNGKAFIYHTYILNTSGRMRVHEPDCRYVDDIKHKKTVYYTSFEELKRDYPGYVRCGHCVPD